MRKSPILFNPSRFDGAMNESHYAKGLGARPHEIAREKLFRIFQSKHSDDPDAQALAERLADCRPGNRCKLAPCPECAHAGQKLFANVAAAFLAKHARSPGQIVCVSIVPADGTCGPDELKLASADRNKRRWKERFGRAGVSWFIGALDYSFNEHDAGRYNSHWSEHIYGLTTTTDVGRLKKELRKQFPATDAIPRPVKVKLWDGDSDAFQYILKPNFWRRVATDDAERFTNDGKRACRATDKQRLKSKQRVRLALYLHELGLHGRLILRWAQFVNRGTTASIEKRAPKP